jgi:hypothetical protein
LELNPNVPRDKMFVDDYNFEAYNAMQLKSMADSQDMKGAELTPPKMGGFGAWWKYLTSAIALAPIDESKPGGIPEGVLRTGGTFVVQTDDIVYQWKDKIPGDHPNPVDVLNAVKRTAVA